MTLDLALTITHILAAGGILHVAHARGCTGAERLFWGLAALSTAFRPLSLFLPFWGKTAEAVGVALFLVVLLMSSSIRETTRTEEDVRKAADRASRLAKVVEEQKAREAAEILAVMSGDNAQE